MRSFLSSLLIAGATLSSPFAPFPALAANPAIEVSIQESLLDQDVIISLTGLQPGENILIQAQIVDDNNILWKSYGFYQADRSGVIDLSKQAPEHGTYQGIDPSGLFWSMQPPDSALGASFKIKADSFSIRFTAHTGNDIIASQEIIRLRKASDLQKIPVRENGLVGMLFIPPSDKPLPVIITLSGSNGGLGENRAQLLASHGFAVLALGYFGVDGLQSNLQDIPLEYFEKAFLWLKSQSNLDSSRVGIYGVSRGAELALILGCWFPESVQAIAAIVPSSVIYGGLNEKTPVNAWLYQGNPIAPFAPAPEIDFSDGKGDDAAHPADTLQSFLAGMQEKKAFEAAAIPVEKLQASLLIVSGGDDRMWPSGLYAEQIKARLKDKGANITCEHLHYPLAGHGINIPNLPLPGPVYYHPVIKRWFSIGGTFADDQKASQDSWKKLIQFFHSAFNTENAFSKN